MSSADDQPVPEQGARTTKRRRGIYLLPNLFTTAGLFAGFYAIVAGMQGRFEAAAVAIFVAMLMDGIDGRIARLTRTESDFGKEYDSLSDMVSFGLAPALVAYSWSLSMLGKFGWLAAFVYAACAALRLARFNTQQGSADKRYFKGLASPAAAAVIAGMVWLGHDFSLAASLIKIPAFIITLAVSALMVSNIRYYSFKDLNLKGEVRFVTVLAVMLIFVLIAIAPPQVLFTVFFLYAVSGPAMLAVAFYKKQQAKHKEQERLRGTPK
ncbi:MAG: CDP-diacylglycerol--serine O-phosphatidyltransferase [Gammaproteobacteria bacterium]|nr:CDP-diacylglycerol--serine O-phosphatidyltransferase [Gammaproteobacteria bacterium]